MWNLPAEVYTVSRLWSFQDTPVKIVPPVSKYNILNLLKPRPTADTSFIDKGLYYGLI